MRRIGGSTAVAAALAGAAATPATAAVGPACATRVVAADAGTSAFCGFGWSREMATITVAPTAGIVTATVRCLTSWGAVFTRSRSVTQVTAWVEWVPGTCTLTLTSNADGSTAHASATPATGPIIDINP